MRSLRHASIASVSIALVLALFAACSDRPTMDPLAPAPPASEEPTTAEDPAASASSTEILILGTAQDAGAPQIACRRPCCERLRARQEHIPVASIALIDALSRRCFLFDATPDLATQLDHPSLVRHARSARRPVDGIFLTHAHIGHYLGLAFLGREALAADDIALYATARMQAFLESSGPWNLLFTARHAHIERLSYEHVQRLTTQVQVSAFAVPHRDEYSDTVGFRIAGPERSAIYLPDVDRIDDELWARLMNCDVLLLDGTFFADGELSGRDMSAIPHPRMRETLARWSSMEAQLRPELWFIHLNHTNPALDPGSAEAQLVQRTGAHIARCGDRIRL